MQSSSKPHDWKSEVRRALGWGLPQLIVLGVAIATMPAVISPSLGASPLVEPSEAMPAVAMQAPPPPLPKVAAGSQPQDEVERLDISGLLERLPFEQRHPYSNKQRYSDLISLLKRQSRPAVSVINLWATHCEPCKTEFKLFKQLQSTWGRDIRFVAIQLGKDDPGDLLAELPRAALDLYDIGTGDGTIRRFFADQDSKEAATIPITMVLDCENRLRWFRSRAITEADAPGFSKFLDKVRSETAVRCPSPSVSLPEPAAPTDLPTAPRCGDERCDPGESSSSCCADCGCASGKICKFSRGRNICIVSSDQLEP